MRSEEVVAGVRDHLHTLATLREALAPWFDVGQPVRGPYLYRWKMPPGAREPEERLIASGGSRRSARGSSADAQRPVATDAADLHADAVLAARARAHAGVVGAPCGRASGGVRSRTQRRPMRRRA